MNVGKKIYDAAAEFAVVGLRLGLAPEQFESALYMALSISKAAKYEMKTFQDIQLR